MRPFIVDARLVAGPERYTSPWTGAPLTAKSLLAASFVWFGLTAMWAKITEGPYAAAAAERLRRAASGFLAGYPARLVDSFGWALDPAVPPLVAAVQEEACDLWRVQRSVSVEQ